MHTMSICRFSLNGVKAIFRSVKNLSLQEHQSKSLLAKYGLNIQNFVIVDSPEDIKNKISSLKPSNYVIKAQILAGGRGRGVFSSGLNGGVHLTQDVNHIGKLASMMIGFNLITKQTPSDGLRVTEIMVAEALDIYKETYLALVLDPTLNGPVFVSSPFGGMDIEEVAKTHPSKIYKEPIDIFIGVTDEQAIRIFETLELDPILKDECLNQIKNMFNLFKSVDAVQVEINPFGQTPDKKIICFDAKINFDDNAKFRQTDIFALEDKSQCDPIDTIASNFKLNYIRMNGDIACLVNGAGLAMATMDMIKLFGGEPANFLDLGGTVQEDGIIKAIELISMDYRAKVILVNIFGGIVDCALVARGIVSALEKLKIQTPVVVRIKGKNMMNARAIISSTRHQIVPIDDFEEAVDTCVRLLNGCSTNPYVTD